MSNENTAAEPGITINHVTQDGAAKVMVNVADVLGFTIAPDMAREVAIALLRHATLCDGGTSFNVGNDGEAIFIGIVIAGKPRPLIGMALDVATQVGARLVAKAEQIRTKAAEPDAPPRGN